MVPESCISTPYRPALSFSSMAGWFPISEGSFGSFQSLKNINYSTSYVITIRFLLSKSSEKKDFTDIADVRFAVMIINQLTISYCSSAVTR